MINKILAIILLILLGVSVLQYELIVYGLAQARGQIHILANARSVEEIVNDPVTPDSTVEKLIFIQQIKSYAVDSLGIKDSKNYTTIYDQRGLPSLWNVTAAEPFALTAVEWKFPIIGSFPYKGFFEYEMALKEKAKLDSDSLDTNIGVVGGWSTLGWFRDPILSNMLVRNKGDLADLIIHELTHGTLFVKDSVEFNENLATFIGREGAKRLLIEMYGKDSFEFLSYEQSRVDSEKFTSHILRGSEKLDSLYKSFSSQEQFDSKQRKKDVMMKQIMSATDTLSFTNKERYREIIKYIIPNNAYFLSFIRYRSKLDVFEYALKNDFDDDLKLYLEYLKEKYPTL